MQIFRLAGYQACAQVGMKANAEDVLLSGELQGSDTATRREGGVVR